MDIPKIKFGDYKISRLIAGGNQISGFSHISKEKDNEMMDYYSTENIKLLWDECLKNGINTMQTRGDTHVMRALREYRNEGKEIYWIAQIASEFKDTSSNIKKIASSDAIAIYHHGTYTDNLFHKGVSGIKQVEDNLKKIKDTGLLVGLGTHRPEVMRHAEENNWDIDFYMASFYNLAKREKSVQAVDGFEQEKFDDNDSKSMIKEIKSTNKQCLAFKILGAGRKANNKEELKKAFDYAFKNIKSDDAVVVGMHQKHTNQVKENSQLVNSVLVK